MTPKNEDFPINIAFIVAIVTLLSLKLFNIIDVSWTVLLAPLWVSLLLGSFMMFIVLTAYLLKNLFDKGDKR